MSFQITDAITDAMPPADLPPVGHDQHMPSPELLRIVIMGSPWAIRAHIRSMHHLGYAEPNDWSRLLPTGRPGEMMVILTKRMRRSLL